MWQRVSGEGTYSHYDASITSQLVPTGGFKPKKFILSLIATGAIRSYEYDEEKSSSTVNVYAPSGYFANIAIQAGSDITSVDADGIHLTANNVQNVSVIAIS